MKKLLLSNLNWTLFYVKNEDFRADEEKYTEVSCENDLVKRGYDSVPAIVPGNIEIDLVRAGKIEDPFFGCNHYKRECEYMHMFYVTRFDYEGGYESPELFFEGIDTVSEIYLNGSLVAKTDNMLIPHTVPVSKNIKIGENELMVHIIPATIAAREYDITPNDGAAPTNYDSLYIRKAPHMFGWDIMPRILSGGIWRDVTLRECKKERIVDDGVFIQTTSVNTEENTALLFVNYNTRVAGDNIREYSILIEGKCGDSSFEKEFKLEHTGGNQKLFVENVKFWYPRYYGEQSLYDVKLTLKRNGEAIDTWERKIGIRTAELVRTSVTDVDGNGEFKFVINGMDVFAMGTNWVPADALHSRDAERIEKILPMITDCGCNIIRIWGGGVYENDALYDYCDENGIMIWQDFVMGCATYPQDSDFCERIRDEVSVIVRRLRNHSSIILWAGDNENDCTYSASWYGHGRRNPNEFDVLTRRIVPEVLRRYDFSRPYLPSSPYIDDEAFALGAKNMSEDHLWGPRDYFKGNFYKNSICHFASETGYHGCPSPDSIEKFTSPECRWTAENNETWIGMNNREWLAHATTMEEGPDVKYAFRIMLMAGQVNTLFGTSVPCSLDDFAKASQISQAEAKKYFIERFRVSKWRRTGIIWWNLIDGWPQISDAVVDYYFVKKLAYHYIKRSQNQFCLMFDEPSGNHLPLYAVNDSGSLRKIKYKVTCLTDNAVVACGEACVAAHSSVNIDSITIADGEKKFYHIEWEGDFTGSNHYVTNIIDIDYNEYISNIKRCGYDEWEGFSK